MFFRQENLQFHLLDVLYFDETDAVCRTYPRPHCALSLRLDADADIEFRTETLHLKTGDLAFFPPDISYIRRAKRDRMIVFHMNLIQGEPPEQVEVLHDERLLMLRPLFEEALEEWNRKDSGYQYRTAAILYRIFGELHSGGTKPEKRNPTVRQAVELLSGLYTEPSLTISEVAKQVHVSETYLRRVFQQELGCSPKQYLNHLRMDRAKALLNAGYDPVSIVAEKVGFRDTKNFATAFKKKFGYPPSRQRYGYPD